MASSEFYTSPKHFNALQVSTHIEGDKTNEHGHCVNHIVRENVIKNREKRS